MRELSVLDARHIWLRAQRLDQATPFGAGPAATPAAVEHLGYVQIDTINVIERCHHQILFTRIPDYQRDHLRRAQAIDKTVFEYWTHALAYVPTRDIRFFLPAMKQHRQEATESWFGPVTPEERRKVLRLLRTGGPLTIQDIKDDVLVEKDHPWASRKPSKRALQMLFFHGRVTVSERRGMVKTYELMNRHFGWEAPPRPATGRQYLNYITDRALRSQGLVSLDSICHLRPKLKPQVRALIEARVRRRLLVPVAVEGAGKVGHWATPQTLDEIAPPQEQLVRMLSPFDPLIILRKRLKLIFDYDHLFEAYVPKDKRVYGYFTQPVLVGDEIVAAIDLKTDRDQGSLLIQQWSWVGRGNKAEHQSVIDEELDRFERFQLGSCIKGPVRTDDARRTRPRSSP